MWSLVPTPPGVSEIGELVAHGERRKNTPSKACCEVFLASTLTYVCPEPVLAKHHDASVFVRMKVQLQTE